MLGFRLRLRPEVRIGLVAALVALAPPATGQTPASPVFPRAPGAAFRVLSWNVSRSGFLEHPAAFRGLVRAVDPDLFLLDEVDGTHAPDDLRSVLRGLRGGGDTVWHVSIGTGGGNQRGAIASREPVEAAPEFARLPYPDSVVRDLLIGADSIRESLVRHLRAGVAAHGAVVRAGGRRLLVVTVDLQCCGVAATWEERRRVFEARTIRQATRDALQRDSVHGLLIAGDLNLVATAIPLAMLLGPYRAPHAGLIPAEAYHRDGRRVWTWDGRGTPFESKPLDFQLYAPTALERLFGLVLDSEDLTAEELAALGIDANASRLISDHRPVVVDYRWR
jgi:endonuclease/exonuclease/phosphatase family metal-dependent hydrolase